MTSVIKLKDEARRYEQQEDWDQAIQLYLRVLRGTEGGDVEVDLPLYNRIGDLYLRLGRAPDAVTYYEQAADHYAEAGLYNNAIALCNKALRYAPGRLALVRKLGRFCALQGFTTDARRWFLTFAERMFIQGAAEEALDALEDFATISEDAEIRELLARHLHGHGKTDEALVEFRRAYGMRIAAGDHAGASELKSEVLNLYPRIDELTPEPLASPEAVAAPAQENHGQQLPGLAETAPGVSTDGANGRGKVPAVPTGFIQSDFARPVVETLPGLESTQLGGIDNAPPPTAAMPGLESTALDGGGPIEDDSDEAQDEVDEDDEDLADEPVVAAPEPEQDNLSRLRAEYTGPTEPDDDFGVDHAAPLPLLDSSSVSDGRAADNGYSGGFVEVAAGVQTVDFGPPPGGFINLHDFIDPEEGRPVDTRFRIEETEPTGDEDRDFAELLAQFKAKLAEAVDPDDAASHYDLGIAFKEMGLVDEAIGEFQRSMRSGGDTRLKILEELGQCFLEKGQYNIATRVLETAVKLRHADGIELIGVFYYLGRAYEALGKSDEARDAYERVMGLDIDFQDVTERINRL